MTEILFDQALRRAESLDQHFSVQDKPIGPLHGLPISLKDTFRVKGCDSSIGLGALCYKPSTSDSPLVSVLLQAGAVIYCKTNVPQTMMSLDSINNIWGRTMNPTNRKVTAGGSSGGEGALAALKGSILGFGTDIGGSIRIPAMCNGVYGVKPSANRVPYSGQESGSLPGTSQVGIESCAGPIARSPRDCALVLRVIADAKPWEIDPLCIPGSWSSMDQSIRTLKPTSTKSLTIGILATDNIITPLPPVRDILHEVADHLVLAGHRVVHLNVPSSFSRAQSIANGLMGPEGSPEMWRLMQATQEPLIPWLAGRLKQGPPKTLEATRELHGRRLSLAQEMLDLWHAADGGDIDAIVCPVAPHPTPPIDRWNGVSYTSAYVLLDYPAGVVPVRTFNEDDLKREWQSEAEKKVLNAWDRVNKGLWDKQSIDRRDYLGTSLCVQVLAPRLQEKRLVNAMEAIDKAIKDGSKRQVGARL